MGTVRGWSSVAISVATCLIAFGRAHAQPTRSEFRLRGVASGGFVISGDQHSALDLDLPVVEGEVRAGWVAHELLVLEARVGGGAFLSSEQSAGGLIDLTVGAELGGSVDVARLWGSVHAGAGVTGDLVRPTLRLAVGIDVAVSDEVAIGPTLAYGHLFQEDGEGYSDDASWATIGVSFTHRAILPEPEPEPEPPPGPRRRPWLTRAPTPPPPPPPPVPQERFMELLDEAAGLEPRELLVPILFHFDSTELVACSVASLRTLRDHLQDHQEIEVLEIEGHADGSGTDAYNRELSHRRAEAIRAWLVEHGVEEDRLRVAARGEAAPVESNEEDAGREQNRRVRFRVVLER